MRAVLLVPVHLAGLLFLGTAARAADVEPIDPDRAACTSQAVVVGSAPLAHTAQVLPLDGKGRLAGKGKAEVQISRVLDNLEAALKAAGSGLDRTVKLNFYAAGEEVVLAVRRALSTRLAGKGMPAVSFVVGKLGHPDALVSADAVGVSRLTVPAGTVKKITDPTFPAGQGAAAAVLPAGPVVYVSGQAEKGKTVAEATRRTLASLRATLRWLSLGQAEVVQVKCFLHPMTKVDDVRGEMKTFFGAKAVPPLVFVEWQAADSIEIELIAAAPAAKEKPTQAVEYLTPPGMTASPLFSRVCRINHGRRIYVSGLYGDGADAAAQVKAVFATLGRALKKGGSDFRHLAKATYYVAGDDASRQLNVLRPRYYDPKRPPAASKAAVSSTGRKGCGITLDMIAVVAP